MLIDLPPNHTISTRIKERVEFVSFLTNTQIDDLSNNLNKLITLDNALFLNFSNSTKLFIKKDALVDNSTWSEFSNEDFDVITKLSFSKTFKVRAKIKTISRFIPKIIIE